MNSYTSLTHPVKTALILRLLIKKLPVKSLHPNPEDEFSDPKVGPNMTIVSQYAQRFTKRNYNALQERLKPITVEKLSTGGYMILNGHHRWLAAKRMGARWLSVQIVNTTNEKDLMKRLEHLHQSMSVSFDLDEVLLCADKPQLANRLPFPLSRLFPYPVRRDAPALLQALRKMGFNIWVYTGSFASPWYIRTTLHLNGAKVDGIINGTRSGKKRQDFRNLFKNKYRTMLHVDNKGVLWLNSDTKDYDLLDLSEGEDWATQVAAAAKKIVKEHDR